MINVKRNLPVWERALRVVSALALIAIGLSGWLTSTLLLGVWAIALTLAVTGLFGFCPACALVGRKLEDRSP